MTPTAPLRPCQQIGCRALVRRGYCDDHARARPAPDQARVNTHRAMYNRRWERVRRDYLTAHPLCAKCDSTGRTVRATELDHIQPHRGDAAIFWDAANWQPLCKSCHSRKTSGQDGGFGNSPGREGGG